MLVIHQLKESEIRSVSEWIAQLNRQKEHHIGYCSENADELAGLLADMLREESPENYFYTAYAGGELVGVLGFDLCRETKSAEMWGPFIRSAGSIHCAASLWQHAVPSLPPDIEAVHMFCGLENANCRAFARQTGFSQQSDEVILSFSSMNRPAFPTVALTELRDGYKDQFVRLHDATFPNTYYSGREILDRINQEQRVFMTSEHHTLTGYIYIEVNEAYQDTSIEFIGVHPDYRGKGLGKKLLQGGLHWILSHDYLDKITLCVSKTNGSAIGLYRSVGFTVDRELSFLKKRRPLDT